MGIQTFQQDVTKPFPEAMYGTFDLVHLSLVVLALTKEGWEKALENCRNLLSTCVCAPFSIPIADESEHGVNE